LFPGIRGRVGLFGSIALFTFGILSPAPEDTSVFVTIPHETTYLSLEPFSEDTTPPLFTPLTPTTVDLILLAVMPPD